MSKTYSTDSPDGNGVLNSGLHVTICTISHQHYSALRADDIYFVYIFQSKYEFEGADIEPSSQRVLIFSDSSKLRFQFLFPSQIYGMSSEILVLQYFKIASVTSNKNHKYTYGVCFCNLTVIQPPRIVICYEQEASRSFFFIDKLFLVYRQFTAAST